MLTAQKRLLKDFMFNASCRLVERQGQISKLAQFLVTKGSLAGVIGDCFDLADKGGKVIHRALPCAAMRSSCYRGSQASSRVAKRSPKRKRRAGLSGTPLILSPIPALGDGDQV